MRRLYLCGAGNPEGVRLAIRVNERLHRWDDLVLLDDDPARLGQSQLGVPVAGPFALLERADPVESEAMNLIARTTARRRAAAARISEWSVPFAQVVSPDVDLLGAEVASDLVAYQNATIGPEVTIGRGSVVFMGAAVGHECAVGDYCVLAANSVLNARVRLGDGVYVGSNAVVLPEIEIGAGATIGAGAVVIDDVPAGATVVAGMAEIVHAGGPGTRAEAPADIAAAITPLWCDVLGVERVDPRQNFFDAGGTSLLALRLLQQIEGATGVALRPVDLYQHSSLAAMIAHLDEMTHAPARAHAGVNGFGHVFHGALYGHTGAVAAQAQLRAELRRQALSGRDGRPLR